MSIWNVNWPIFTCHWPFILEHLYWHFGNLQTFNKINTIAQDKADDEDFSTEQVWKAYKKNCQALEIPVNKRIKEMYEVEYVEDRKNFTKVSLKN